MSNTEGQSMWYARRIYDLEEENAKLREQINDCIDTLCLRDKELKKMRKLLAEARKFVSVGNNCRAVREAIDAALGEKK